MGAVADRLLLLGATDRNTEVVLVKGYLRLDPHETVEEGLLTRLIADAKDLADSYLNNDFGGGSIPGGIETWVLQEVARTYELRVGGLAQVQEPGVGSMTIREEVDFTRLDRYRLLPGI